MTPTTRTWVDNGTLDFNGFTPPPVSSGGAGGGRPGQVRLGRRQDPPRNESHGRCGPSRRWDSVPRGSGGTRPVSVGDRAVAPIGGHSRTSAVTAGFRRPC